DGMSIYTKFILLRKGCPHLLEKGCYPIPGRGSPYKLKIKVDPGAVRIRRHQVYHLVLQPVAPHGVLHYGIEDCFAEVVVANACNYLGAGPVSRSIKPQVRTSVLEAANVRTDKVAVDIKIHKGRGYMSKCVILDIRQHRIVLEISKVNKIRRQWRAG